ncbi:MAG: CBS domain-containing protein [Gemmatimonadota bacterium]|jgi:CBS domain-containing protein
MGQDVSGEPTGPDAVRAFTKALLRDLQALEQMLQQDLIESGVRRIGAEQEMFLVNRGWRPAPVSLEVLEQLNDPAYTTELARFNLEANVEPRLLEGRCFSDMERRIQEMVDAVRDAASDHDADVALVGILPTLSKSDLSLENITPRPRYFALNDALSRMRGGEPYKLRIEGTDELYIEHDSVMLEACNTSCQVHLQVEASEFAHVYNVAQLITAPVLAAAVNSPVLLAKRLWDETRIALFQQSVDTRSATVHMRELSPRVRFGEHWVSESVTELFQEDIARFRVLLTSKVDEDPLQCLKEGKVPRLQALQLHNSTVYRWNRPCYGVGGGKPHLRIECRVLPAGPTILDEVANAAFWIGLVMGGARRFGDVSQRIEFDEVKENFLAASRHGLKAGFHWLEGETWSARRLILDELLPLAREGLTGAGVDASDVDRYLGVIQERVEAGITGTVWMMRSFAAMKDHGTRAERLAAVTAGIVHRQRQGAPAHTWEPADIHEAGGWRSNYVRVEQYMTTSLFTVHEDELVDMVAFLMDRKTIRHVLVEDDQHRLVGIVSYRSLIRLMAEDFSRGEEAPPVKAIMERDPVSVAPETPTLDAIDLMRRHRVSCLPVVKQGKLVGIVSERDFMPIAYELLEEKLREL